MIEPVTGSHHLPAHPVAVLGIGNVLLGDDAVGPAVVAMLAAGYRVPPAVSLLDVGTPGIDLADYLAGLHTAILVDSVRLEAPPGTRCRLDKSQLIGPAGGGKGLRRAGHDPALRDTLLALDLCGLAPAEVIFIGVVPGSTATHLGRSDVVRAAARLAAGDVAAELRRLGLDVRERPSWHPPDLWWERDPSRPPGPPPRALSHEGVHHRAP